MDAQYVWDGYYKTHPQRLIYPDENLVRILEKQDLTQCKRALDFGCGSARHLIYLKQKHITELYGMDISLEVIKKNQALYENIQFLHYEVLMPLPFPENFFDIIICWGVLHYNKKTVREFLLEEFYRTLKPGGLFTGTYRAKNDTHFKDSEVHMAEIDYFEEKEILLELKNKHYKQIQLGYCERTPLGNLQKKIAHYFFLCTK